MLGQNDTFLYDPSRPHQKMYNSHWCYAVLVPCGLFGVASVITGLVKLLNGEPNVTGGFIWLSFAVICAYFLIRMVHYNEHRYGHKLALYKLYVGLSKADKKKYKKHIRIIHSVNLYNEFPISVNKLAEIFRSRQTDNPDSYDSLNDAMDDELLLIKQTNAIRRKANADIEKINKEAGL